jgi:enoyl-[acyl-carrier-protein] reductase (NADH)
MSIWEIIKDLFIAGATIGGGMLGNNITQWLQRIHTQLQELTETQVRHDERIHSIHERLDYHESRIDNLEKK